MAHQLALKRHLAASLAVVCHHKCNVLMAPALSEKACACKAWRRPRTCGTGSAQPAGCQMRCRPLPAALPGLRGCRRPAASLDQSCAQSGRLDGRATLLGERVPAQRSVMPACATRCSDGAHRPPALLPCGPALETWLAGEAQQAWPARDWPPSCACHHWAQALHLRTLGTEHQVSAWGCSRPAARCSSWHGRQGSAGSQREPLQRSAPRRTCGCGLVRLPGRLHRLEVAPDGAASAGRGVFVARLQRTSALWRHCRLLRGVDHRRRLCRPRLDGSRPVGKRAAQRGHGARGRLSQK